MAITEKLTNIANAIRVKGGTTATLKLAEMPAAIANLPSGGGIETVSATINFVAIKTLTVFHYIDGDGNHAVLALTSGTTSHTITAAKNTIVCATDAISEKAVKISGTGGTTLNNEYAYCLSADNASVTVGA